MELGLHGYDSAERDYRAVIALDPTNPFQYRGLAKVYEAEWRTKDAYQAWSKVIRGRPGASSSEQTDPYVLAHFGDLCMRVGDTVSAGNAYALASAHMRPLFGSQVEEIACSREATLAPETLVQYDAGVEMCLGGQKEMARRELETVVRLAPQWALCKITLGTELDMEGRPAEAERLFEAAEGSRDTAISRFATAKASDLGLDRNHDRNHDHAQRKGSRSPDPDFGRIQSRTTQWRAVSDPAALSCDQAPSRGSGSVPRAVGALKASAKTR